MPEAPLSLAGLLLPPLASAAALFGMLALAARSAVRTEIREEEGADRQA